MVSRCNFQALAYPRFDAQEQTLCQCLKLAPERPLVYSGRPAKPDIGSQEYISP